MNNKRVFKEIDEPVKYIGECEEAISVIEYEDELEKTFEGKISIIEFAIINNFLFKSMSRKLDGIESKAYGFSTPDIGRVGFGGSPSDIEPWWFSVKWDKIDDEVLIQTIQYRNSYGYLCHLLNISTKKGLKRKEYVELFKDFRKIAYNNSEYKGKCLKIVLKEGDFQNIEILDTKDFNQNIILNDTQKRFLSHFVKRVKRGNTARYLLNGTPGTGKTESIRKIVYDLLGEATFIIPEFYNVQDLIQILESCNIFDPGVIIIDDIDLYLGSRDKGGYTSLLGQFLSFFDGVKKNKISILASTNDKGLVDKAAERPGRFNMTLDFSYLVDEQIEEVCKIHLDPEWQIKEVYDALRGNDSAGNKVKITGAFVANLAENIREMAKDEEGWSVEDTIVLIKETYKGFYSSQIEKERKKIGLTN